MVMTVSEETREVGIVNGALLAPSGMVTIAGLDRIRKDVAAQYLPVSSTEPELDQ